MKVRKAAKKLFLAAVVSMLLLPQESTNADKQVPEGMVVVPAGWFKMGGKDDEKQNGPPRRVYLDAFAIDKYEVTNAEFKKFFEEREKKTGKKLRSPPKCMAVSKDGKPAPKIWGENMEFPPQLANHPVVCVKRVMARFYCKKNGKRLPTEAEWEKAARGTDGRKYPWGNKWDQKKTNHGLGKIPWENDSDGYARTAPVGSFPKDKSPYGVYDMAGNVWEWTEDFYWTNYHSGTPDKNPGPVQFNDIPEKERWIGAWYTVRGGSWALGEKATRTWRRIWRPDYQADDSGGFRCAIDLK